jgi:WD40 repeat protein
MRGLWPGRHLASGSDDKTIKVWDVEAGGAVKTLQGHTDSVVGVAFSPDGTRLASASQKGAVKLWDWALGEEALTLKEPGDAVAVAFSPDGEQLARASWCDAIVVAWTARPVPAPRNAGAAAAGAP